MEYRIEIYFNPTGNYNIKGATFLGYDILADSVTFEHYRSLLQDQTEKIIRVDNFDVRAMSHTENYITLTTGAYMYGAVINHDSNDLILVVIIVDETKYRTVDLAKAKKALDEMTLEELISQLGKKP